MSIISTIEEVVQMVKAVEAAREVLATNEPTLTADVLAIKAAINKGATDMIKAVTDLEATNNALVTKIKPQLDVLVGLLQKISA